MSNRKHPMIALFALLLIAAPVTACREKKPAPKEEHKPGDGHDHDKDEHKPGDGHDHGSATPRK